MNYINFPVPEDKFAAVCALLAGTSAVALAAPVTPGNASVAVTPASEPSPSAAAVGTASTTAAPVSSEPVSGDVELDAGGWPWSADLHASTKGKTKEGYWRMAVGKSRPENKPGFPKDGGTPAPAPSAASAPSASATVEDDEFAAFRAAAMPSTPSAAPARSWTDADLSQLCNQAAIADGGPDRVKGIIAKFVPEGAAQHSRSIPTDQREAFAQEVEATFGIKYAG